MEEMIPFLFFMLFFVVFIAVVVVAVVMERKRRAAWQALAEQLGFTFAEKDHSMDDRYSFAIFGKGHGRVAKNILTGEANGIAVTLADYQYTTGGGKNSTTHRQTLCILENPDLDLPAMSIRPETPVSGFLLKMVEWLGVSEHDIDFEEDPEFSSAFLLSGPDEAAVRAVMTPERRAFFTARREQLSRFLFEAEGSHLLVHMGRTIKPDECQDLLQTTFELMSIW